MSVADSTGVSMDRYADLLQTFIDLAIEWKGASVSTDEQEFLGFLIRSNALLLAEVNEIVQDVANQLSVSDATGARLANLLALVGIEIQSNARSTVTLTLTVTKATTIPAGALARTAANVYFATDEDLVFSGAGSDDVSATCTVDGPHDAAIGEVNVIVTNINGWSAVTNAAAAVPGRLREKDPEAKARHAITVATHGDRDAASIYESVFAIDGVSKCRVDEDYTSDTPVSVYVIGGSDADVAEAIDNQLTVGIGTAGTTAVAVYNETLAQSKTINFTRATTVDHYIRMVLTKNEALFPADGETQIEDALTAIYALLRIGETVRYLSLPGAILGVPGVVINELYLDDSAPASGTSDLPVDTDKLAVLETANISITFA